MISYPLLKTMSTYTRETELRNVQPNDLYRLSVILDENGYWRKLMETIPKELNNQEFGNSSDIGSIFPALSTTERKYGRDHLRLLEDAVKRSGESRLCSQILFDEWGSSGRKHERPTLGVLLHLLWYTQLFRAADFVAEALLKEPNLFRPADGPGAEFTCDLPSSFFDDVHKLANESINYPDTELLQQYDNCSSNLMDNNKDFYTKYREPLEKHFAPSDWSLRHKNAPPIPPPRSNKSARMRIKQLKPEIQLSQNPSDRFSPVRAIKDAVNFIGHEPQVYTLSSDAVATENNIPKISLLMNATTSSIEEIHIDSSIAYGDSLPKLSFLRGNSKLNNVVTSEVIYSSSSIPNILYSKIMNPDHIHYDLPAISALNLNGERDTSESPTQSNEKNLPFVALNVGSSQNTTSNINTDFNIPSIVSNIVKEGSRNAESEDGLGVHINGDNKTNNTTYERVGIDSYEGNFEDDEDVPNLSIFNESSLTSVTSGENSFEHIVESRPTSVKSVPNNI